MPITQPPDGYVGIVEAEQIAEVTAQTIIAAAKRGDLAGRQRVKNAPWFFRPEALREWRERVSNEKRQLVTTGRE